MSIVYVAVRSDYFRDEIWPSDTYYASEAMSVIWNIPDVKFLRNNHPLGDLYKVRVPVEHLETFIQDTDEDKVVFTLKYKVGTIVTDIDARRI